MAIDQTHLNFRLETPLGGNALVVSRFRCHEAISQLPRCELELASDQLAIDFKTIIGKPVLLTLDRPGGSQRCFHGIVTRFAQRPPTGSHARYEAEVQPTLWVLTQRRNSRIFQEKTVPEIVKALLDEASIPKLEDKITGKHPLRGYCVQYQETDFDFISRLMEEEGIFYYYRHDAEDGHTLVLSDGTEFDPVPGIAQAIFEPNADKAVGGEVLHRFQRVQHLRTARYVVDDYNLFDPKTDLLAQAEATLPQELPAGTFEIFDYPSGQVKQGDEEEGKLAFAEGLVALRVEAVRAAAGCFHADGNIHGLLAGHRLSIAKTSRTDFDGDYLITALRLEGDQSGSFETLGGSGGAVKFAASLDCQPLAQAPVYRPPLRTPRPRMAGPQTAVVVGPAGEEIHTDRLGRVCLQFHWDRYGQADDKSSCFVRVSQSWAGNLWGAFVLPRIGMEVVVDFLDGDPDRPLVTGAVYNAMNLPPYTLPDSATQSTFKSQSSTGGQGANELRFEDRAGTEQIYLHAQQDFDLQANHDRHELVGNDRHLTVKHDRFEQTDSNLHEKIDLDHRIEIGQDHHLNVVGKEAAAIGGSRSVKIGGDVNEKIAGSHAEKVDGDVYVDSGGNVVIEAATSITLKVGGNFCVVDNSGVTVKGSIVTLDGGMTNINSGPGSSAQSSSLGSLVPPAAPDPPIEPEAAPPGDRVSTPEAHKPPKTVEQVKEGEAASKATEEAKQDWIAIQAQNEDGEPLAGEKYEVKLPDGSVATGTLDEKGRARVECIDPGQCEITFPDLDKKDWEKDG